MSDDLQKNYADRPKAAPAVAPGTNPGTPAEPVTPEDKGKAKPEGDKPALEPQQDNPKLKAEKLIELARQTREALIAGVEVLHAESTN